MYLIKQKKFNEQENFYKMQTLLAHLSPHALQRDLGPAGPRRIIGVDLEPIPQ